LINSTSKTVTIHDGTNRKDPTSPKSAAEQKQDHERADSSGGAGTHKSSSSSYDVNLDFKGDASTKGVLRQDGTCTPESDGELTGHEILGHVFKDQADSTWTSDKRHEREKAAREYENKNLSEKQRNTDDSKECKE
jgi:hypothetical protein